MRLNQAAASALLARLEAQKAICDSSERELHRKFKQRDDLEKQIRPEWEQAARKRSRNDDTLIEEDDEKIALCLEECEQKMQLEMEENDTLCEETAGNALLCLPEIKSAAHSHKELRKFLEEEQIASLPCEEGGEEEVEGEKETTTKIRILKPDLDKARADVAGENEYIVEERLEKLEIEDGGKVYNIQFPFPHETEEEEDEESRRQRGKGNIEKWMQFLLENMPEDAEIDTQISNGKETTKAEPEGAEIDTQISNGKETTKADELIEKMNMIYPHRDSRAQKIESRDTEKLVEEQMDKQPIASEISDDKENDKSLANMNTPFKNPPYRVVTQRMMAKELASAGKGAGRMSSPDEKVRRGKIVKEKELVRSESARAFRRIPSSPTLILEGMKKRVDCIGRKPLVHDDNDGNESLRARNSFIKSSIKTIKKAVRI